MYALHGKSSIRQKNTQSPWFYNRKYQSKETIPPSLKNQHFLRHSRRERKKKKKSPSPTSSAYPSSFLHLHMCLASISLTCIGKELACIPRIYMHHLATTPRPAVLFFFLVRYKQLCSGATAEGCNCDAVVQLA